LGDEVMAEALIYRRLHHCLIVIIKGNSYRTGHYAELGKDLADALGAPSQPPGSEPSERNNSYHNGDHFELMARIRLNEQFQLAESVQFQSPLTKGNVV
jgi:hypothetical protein